MPRGRRRGDPLRMLLFNFLYLFQETIVLIVGDDRLSLAIIQPVVLAYLF